MRRENNRLSVPLLIRSLALAVPAAIAIGSAVALFLALLDWVTTTRVANPWLLWLLPVAGLLVGWIDHTLGRSAAAGTNLIFREIQQPRGSVPARLAPLVLGGTLLTHLFGGSAGREGTAVQMGGAIAGNTERLLRRCWPALPPLDDADRRVQLQTGMAAGFGAVFGTPIAGALFAVEVVTVGRLSWRALPAALLAALLADRVTMMWGVGHAVFPHVGVAPLTGSITDALLLIKVLLAAVAFGLTSRLFASSAHIAESAYRRVSPRAWLRPALGGLVVMVLVWTVGTHAYLGLGVAPAEPGAPSILGSFTGTDIMPWSWVLKLLFTVCTIGAGFKGGEVTPLFFIGATLGVSLAAVFDAPVALFAAIGLVAVFAGATNTPIACAIMGVELFGAEVAAYVTMASVVAYWVSGRTGIYRAQRFADDVTGDEVRLDSRLRNTG